MPTASSISALHAPGTLLFAVPQANAHPAHDFAGHYVISGSQFLGVTRIAAHLDKVSFPVMLERGAGSFNTVRWNSIGTARRTVLTIGEGSRSSFLASGKTPAYLLNRSADVNVFNVGKALAE
jgi:hypothetical protein